MRQLVVAPSFHALSRSADARGYSYSLPPGLLDDMAQVADVHLASLEPGAVRGNHLHLLKTEIIAVTFSTRWVFAWDTGEGTRPEQRVFDGAGSVAVVVSPGAAHALANTGDSVMVMTEISNRPYDPANPDVIGRRVW